MEIRDFREINIILMGMLTVIILTVVIGLFGTELSTFLPALFGQITEGLDSFFRAVFEGMQQAMPYY